MATSEPDKFNELMFETFGLEGARQFATLQAYTTEPFNVSVADMVSMFETLPQIDPSVKDDEEALRDGVITALSPLLPVDTGDLIELSRARSYLNDDIFCQLPDGVKIIGSWLGLSVGTWFDTPVDEYFNYPELYTREAGLCACLDLVTISYLDEQRQTADIVVPLEHGLPEWRRVITPF
ncbi:MAG: hypothetical protein AAB459_03045 [Patescibacteria group bacterium]